MTGVPGTKNQGSSTLQITSRFTDNSRSILIVSIVLFLLLAVAVGVAALVKVILLENKKDDRYEEVAKQLSELREEFDGFSMNVTDQFDEYNKTDKELMEKTLNLFRVSGIKEEIVGPPPPTYTSAAQLCDDESLRLCSVKELFPEPGVFFNNQEFPGTEWVPIRDEYNDWIQIGKGNLHTFGRGTFRSIHGIPPDWGESQTSGSLKKRIFCCAAF